MRKLIGTVVVAGIFSMNPAVAAPADANGFFLGGSLGLTEFDDDGAFSGLQSDDTDTSIIGFAGYKFFRYFALEARVGDLGSYAVSNLTIDVDIASVHAVGIVPFGESGWELYGQLGLGNAEFSCDGCLSESSGSETVGSAGAGFRYWPTQNIGVGVQIDAYAWEELGQHDFSVATTQVVFQYLF